MGKISELCPIVVMTEGNWAAHEAVKNKLVNLKKHKRALEKDASSQAREQKPGKVVSYAGTTTRNKSGRFARRVASRRVPQKADHKRKIKKKGTLKSQSRVHAKSPTIGGSGAKASVEVTMRDPVPLNKDLTEVLPNYLYFETDSKTSSEERSRYQ